jgi:NhaP-type Na+/H+ or K+/H+ antiporter
MVILMRAGLGLDREKLLQQGTVALRLGCLPAMTEAIAIAWVAIVWFQFDLLTGLLLGCVVGAESPAVIVPGMLRLKSLGWGIAKGIPDAILVGSALSDVLILLCFSLLLGFLDHSQVATSALQSLPWQALVQVGLGVGVGSLAAQVILFVLVRLNWTQAAIQDVMIAAGVALVLVLGAQAWPYYSGYLATMTLGFCLTEWDPPLARRLRLGFSTLWVVAEIVLFVLLGASIQLSVLGNTLGMGLVLLSVGLLGRMVGWSLSTLGSNWTWRERLFLLPGNSAKATVQAAIGAIPLAHGIPGGEIILAIAALSILVTAPLGAWAIPTFAPQLLQQDPVDPAKVAITSRTLLLAAVDTSPLATQVLSTAADLARRSAGEVIVLHVLHPPHASEVNRLQAQTQRLLTDIRHQFMTLPGPIPEAIVATAHQQQVTAIVMGKRGHRPWTQVLVGSSSQAVLRTSDIPVILVEPPSLGV